MCAISVSRAKGFRWCSVQPRQMPDYNYKTIMQEYKVLKLPIVCSQLATFYGFAVRTLGTSGAFKTFSSFFV